MKSLALPRSAVHWRQLALGLLVLVGGVLLARQCTVRPLHALVGAVLVPMALVVLFQGVTGGTVGLLTVCLATLATDPFLPDVLPVAGYRVSLGKVVVAATVVCLWARAAATESGLLLRHAVTLPAALLATVLCAHVPLSPFPEVTTKRAASFVSLVVMAHVVATLVARGRWERNARGIAWALLLLGALSLVLYPLGIMLDGEPAIDGRASGTLDNPNEWAAFCLAGIPWLWAESTSRRGRQRWVFTAAAAVLGVSVLLSFSRGAYLAALLTAVVALLLARRLSLRLIVVAVGLALAIDQVFPLAQVAERFLTSFDMHATADTSIANRATILDAGIQVFLAHPLFGCGLGGFPIESAAVAHVPFGTDAHNTFLTIAAETGIVGILGFAWLLVPLLVRLKQHALGRGGDPRVRGLLLGLLAMGFMATTVTLHLQGYVWFWIGCAMGLTPGRAATEATA